MKTAEGCVSPVSDYFVHVPSKTARRMFFYPVQCGQFTYDPGYTLSRNSFDSFLLMYIQSGNMTLNFGGKTQHLPEKSFVLLDCYQPHGYAAHDGAECLWIHYDGILARAYYESITARLGQAFVLGDAYPVLKKMNAILHVFSNRQTVHEAQISKYFTDIFTSLLLSTPGDRRPHTNADIVDRSIQYIGEHFDEDIKVDLLAQQARLSPCCFIRIFKQETGYTPHEYLINRRMASARYLLKYTDLTIKEISFSTGFSCESVFCNAFKKKHGLTPLQFRTDPMPQHSSVTAT